MLVSKFAAGFALLCLIVGNKDLSAQPAITPVILKTTVTAPGIAQAKDKLFWYKGKKVNDSTLITPESKTIQYSQERNLIIVQPKAKDPAISIIKEVEKTAQRKNQLFSKFASRASHVTLYPAIEKTLREYDEIAKEYNVFLKNTILLPPAIQTSGSSSTWPKTAFNIAMISSGYLATVNKTLPAAVKKAYSELLDRKKNYPPLDFPAPPIRDYGTCLDCDSNNWKSHESEEAKWLEEFVQYESDLLRRSFEIQRTLEDLNIEKDIEAIEIKNGTEQAIEFAFARASNKVDLLIRNYGNDFNRLSSVIKAAISIERQKQLAGVGKDSYAKTITSLLNMFDGLEKYLEQQMDARNYDFVLNIPLFVGLERQRQLLGDSAQDANRLDRYFKKLNAFNRFRFEMQIDYNGSWEACGMVHENFTATNGLTDFASLGFYGCKFRFFPQESMMQNAPFNLHYGKWFGPELIITNGTTYESIYTDDDKCYNVAHNMKGLAVHPYMPIDGISFCDGIQDSMAVSKLHLPGSRENREDKRYGLWRFDDFDDEIQRDGLTESEAEQIYPDEQMMEELKDEQENFEMQPPKQPGQEEMKKHYTNTMLTHQLRKKFFDVKEKAGEGLIVFDAKNGSEIIVDGEAKKTYSSDDKKANVRIRVKITHDPMNYKNIK